jgi:hypothetical protein
MRLVPRPKGVRNAGPMHLPPRERSVIRLPSLRAGARDPVLYAHANRVLHLETNPGNARALVQRTSCTAASRATCGSTRRRSR